MIKLKHVLLTELLTRIVLLLQMLQGPSFEIGDEGPAICAVHASLTNIVDDFGGRDTFSSFELAVLVQR